MTHGNGSRGEWWRWVGRLALIAIALWAAVVLPGAANAQNSPICWWEPVFRGDFELGIVWLWICQWPDANEAIQPDPGGGGGDVITPEQARKMYMRAVRMAQAMLANPDCANFLAAAVGDAKALFETLTSQGHVFLHPTEFDPGNSNAFASAGPFGAGAGGQVDVWALFWSAGHIDMSLRQRIPATAGWSDKQMRALILLHELAHLTGKLKTDHSNWPRGSIGFDRDLVTHCHP